MHASTATSEPGLVEQRMGQGLIVGEPTRGESERTQRVAALLKGAGFDATVSASIRQDIWYKLWGNMTINPVTAVVMTQAMTKPVILILSALIWKERTVREQAVWGAAAFILVMLPFLVSAR